MCLPRCTCLESQASGSSPPPHATPLTHSGCDRSAQLPTPRATVATVKSQALPSVVGGGEGRGGVGAASLCSGQDPCRLSLGRPQPFPQRVALRSTAGSPEGCPPRCPGEAGPAPLPPGRNQDHRHSQCRPPPAGAQGRPAGPGAPCGLRHSRPSPGGGARPCSPSPVPAGESPPETASECGEGAGALIAHLLLQAPGPGERQVCQEASG